MKRLTAHGVGGASLGGGFSYLLFAQSEVSSILLHQCVLAKMCQTWVSLKPEVTRHHPAGARRHLRRDNGDGGSPLGELAAAHVSLPSGSPRASSLRNSRHPGHPSMATASL